MSEAALRAMMLDSQASPGRYSHSGTALYTLYREALMQYNVYTGRCRSDCNAHAYRMHGY